MAETVELDLEIPESLYNALRFIAQHSSAWAGNDTADIAVTHHLKKAISEYVKAQADSGFPEACEYMKEEITNLLQ